MYIPLSKIVCREGDPSLKPVDKLNKWGQRYLQIQETLHYKALVTKDFTAYENYIKKTGQKDHSVDKFKKLEEEFALASYTPIQLSFDSERDSLIVQDGVHRLSILLYKGLIGESISRNMVSFLFTKPNLDFLKLQLRLSTKETLQNGWNNRTEFGYHSFNLGNFKVQGQRDPTLRLRTFRREFAFQDKVVLDLGCNTGGMLMHLPEIKKGYGVDLSISALKAAAIIAKYTGSNIDLFSKNLDNDLSDLKTKIVDTVDCIFLLSMGSWIKSWTRLYDFALSYKCPIFFETNNTKEGEPQVDYLKSKGCLVKLLEDKSMDDSTGNFGRSLYFVTPNPV